MLHHPLLDAVAEAASKAPPRSHQREILQRATAMLSELHRQIADSATPERVREKLRHFVAALEASHERLGQRMLEPTFLLNAVGEAMGRSELIHQAVVSFVQVGLYFFGLDQIERRWPREAVSCSAVHAEHLGTFISRDGLKAVIARAKARLAEGRPYCLSWHYLNSLRTAFLSYCRHSHDALDHTAVVEELDAMAREVSTDTSAENRMQLVLDVFRTELTPEQQRIYLAQHGTVLSGETPSPLAELMGLAGGDSGQLGWGEIAARVGLSEKSAKREYLRALHALLAGVARRTFGPGPLPVAMVRRIQDALLSSIREKDLRLKDHNTGRGMGVLVEKWQVALRFVLASERISA
jgi:hypothetical protein